MKWLFLIMLTLSTNFLYSQSNQQLIPLMATFEAVQLPFELNSERVNTIYQKITQQDSLYLRQLVHSNTLTIVNPLTESAYGMLDDLEDLTEAGLPFYGGSILYKSVEYTLIYFLLDDVGFLFTIDKKSGQAISSLITDRYSGMGHAQVGRNMKIDTDRTIKIEEVCWGRSVEPSSQYTLQSEYTIDEEGYFNLKKVEFTRGE